MAQWQKLLDRILRGRADANIHFDDLRGLLMRLGFQLIRISGSHHIYAKNDIPEIIDIQPLKDGKAKSYQIKQVRMILTVHGLTSVN